MDFDLSSLPITHEATIPESYRDVMGHMNVMWYTHLFDQSIYEVFRQIGLDEAYQLANRAGSFALESHTRYLAEVLVGDSVVVRTRIVGRTEKRFHLISFMTKGDLLSATFEVVGCYIDMRDRSMAPLPAEIAQQLDKLWDVHRQLPWQPPLCGSMAP